MAITLDGTTGISSVDGSNASPSLRGTDANSGIVYAADTVSISTGGTERLEVDSSGNIDIPDNGKIRLGGSGDLELYHNGTDNFIKNVNGAFKLLTGSEYALVATANAGVDIYYNDVKTFSTISEGARVQADEGASAVLELWADQGDDDGDKWRIVSDQSSNYFYLQNYASGSFETTIRAAGNGNIELYYDNSKKIETQSAGLKWYGSGTGNGSLTYINDVAGDNKHAEYRFERTGRSTNLCSIIYLGENGSSQGEVIIMSSAQNANISGGVVLNNGATSWANASDIRLKDKTGDITNALTDIAKIEPIKFTWKADAEKTPHVGVSAQSIENVVPEAVSKLKDKLLEEKGDDTEYLQVRYTELIPLCIAAIKEAKTKIETLETEVNTLKTKVAALEAG